VRTEDESAYALQQPSSNGTVYIAGFCWGGGQSFNYATNLCVFRLFRRGRLSIPQGQRK
jgi:dienelactone hydrolase